MGLTVIGDCGWNRLEETEVTREASSPDVSVGRLLRRLAPRVWWPYRVSVSCESTEVWVRDRGWKALEVH